MPNSLQQAYLGIDGGGSKTRALIADAQANTLAIGIAEGCNPHNIGFPQAAKRIDEAVRNALAEGTIDLSIVSAFCGIAGIRDLQEQTRLADELQCFSWARNAVLTVDHDLAIAYEAALEDQTGICLICGTGSSCLGRDHSNKVQRTSGRSLGNQDPGSGYAIGQAAIEAGLATTTSSPEDRKAVAQLAHQVVEQAKQGGEVARSILEENAETLITLVRQTHSKLQLGDAFDCAITGGLGSAPTIYQAIVLEKLAIAFPQATPRFAKRTPVQAAAKVAIRQATT